MSSRPRGPSQSMIDSSGMLFVKWTRICSPSAADDQAGSLFSTLQPSGRRQRLALVAPDLSGLALESLWACVCPAVRPGVDQRARPLSAAAASKAPWCRGWSAWRRFRAGRGGRTAGNGRGGRSRDGRRDRQSAETVVHAAGDRRLLPPKIQERRRVNVYMPILSAV